MKKTLIVLVAILALVCSFAIAEECAHDLTTVKLNDATCGKAETYKESCSKCDYSHTFTVGSALEHNYSKTLKSKADCDSAAEYAYKCANCGDTYTKSEGSALGHKYVKTLKTAGTCETKAVYAVTCSACDYSAEEVGALGEHNWKVETSSKVCTEIIYTEKCTVCGTVNQTWTKDSGKKHNWAISSVEADCVNAKTYTEKCTVCPAVNQTWTEGTTLPHSFTASKVIVAGSCLVDEESQYICAVCGAEGDKFVSKKAPGHTAVVVPGYAATCENAGLSDGSKCSVCGTELKAQVVIPATGHDYKTNRVVKPTETKRGYTEYKCEACGDWYRARYTAALGAAVEAPVAAYGEIVTDLDDVAMPYTAETDEEIGRVIITATDIDVLRELHISLALVEEWKAAGIVEVAFIVDDAEIVVPFAVLETEMMEQIKAGFPVTLTGYIVTLDPTAVNEIGTAGCLVKVDLTADTAEEDGIEMEVTDVIEGMKLNLGETVITVVGGGIYTA